MTVRGDAAAAIRVPTLVLAHRPGGMEANEAGGIGNAGLVDQLGAGVGEVRERSADVVDLVRDVVHARAALREEAADGRVLAERAKELEPALTDPDRGGLDALLVDARAMLEPRTEKALVGVERTVQILDCETDVVDRARRLHPGDRM